MTSISKLVAGREKDLDFIGALLRHGMVETAVLRDRLERTPIDAASRERSLLQLNRLQR